MDNPEVIARLFFPRPAQATETSEAFNRTVQVEENVRIVCRFFPSRNDAPNLLFFHGNGETAPDYDYVAPFYRKSGINLFVADFRGYGMSNGSPSCSGIIKDAHPIYQSATGIINSHQGFDTDGKVTDAEKAVETIKSLAEKNREIRAIVGSSAKTLRETTQAFREANPRPEKAEGASLAPTIAH